MNKKTESYLWLQQAKDDLIDAEILFKSGRYSHCLSVSTRCRKII